MAGHAPLLEIAPLWSLVEARAAATPDALFAVDEQERELSFAGYRDAALRCAAGLQALGLGEGAAVSWSLPTWLESMILVGGLARIGAVQNPILPIYREREFGFICRQSRARMLVVPGTFRGFDYAAMARDIAAQQAGLEVLVVDRTLPDADPATLAPWTEPTDDPVRWIFYTSGTTSDPKGARHTDGTLSAFSLGLSERVGLQADDRVALVFPFTHIGGIGWLYCGLQSGAGHIAVEAFDPKTSIPLLSKHGVTQATAGTAFHQAYLAAQRAQPDVKLFPHVRTFPGGGAPKPPALHYEIKNELGGSGIVSGYGMTECPTMAMNRAFDDDEKLAHTEGQASPPEVELRVVGIDGRVAAAGEEGEIRVKAPQLCKGYLDERLDAAAFDADGFFRTGDLGHLDADGYVVITGRLTDVIIRNGENISAKEVEDLLYTHPDVEDVAVIGLPDPKTGERACAVVVPKAGRPLLDFAAMTEHLRAAKLMKQKIPEQLEIVPDLPRNPTGKVVKHELRKRFVEATAGDRA
jgi:acyl-CoA synthetase (AMP-forming)/AMP-acid ligase II